jgi:hypothetical protein
MRFNKFDGEPAGFERITKPSGGRFRQSTVHQPRNTRRDRITQSARLAALGLSSDAIREG